VLSLGQPLCQKVHDELSNDYAAFNRNCGKIMSVLTCQYDINSIEAV
jgi:hypothetical protein